MLRQAGDLRKTPRRTMRRVGEIIFCTPAVRIRCIIADMSDGGARLIISHALPSLAHTFTLTLFKDGSANRDCKIVWTDRRQVGVKFTSEWYARIDEQASKAGDAPRTPTATLQRN